LSEPPKVKNVIFVVAHKINRLARSILVTPPWLAGNSKLIRASLMLQITGVGVC